MSATCPAASKPRRSSRFKRVASGPRQSPRIKKVATKPQQSPGIKKAVSTPRRSPRFKETESASEWLALDVKDIDEKKLLPGVIGKDGLQPHLPTRTVKIPFDYPDQVAVVSWRWDGDLQTKGSRNIASVIRVAKQRGIRYLFIDIISINQKLPTNDLIVQVAAFSALYTKITVLAAYDLEGKPSFEMMYTIYRPWILNETRLFRRNPGRIMYAGHSGQGSQLMDISGEYRDPELHNKDSYPTGRYPHFAVLLGIVWRTGLMSSIGGVLCGDIGMSFVSDFKYIIPAYSHIISVAYERMERNDYLLTIAIFCSNFTGSTPGLISMNPERLLPIVSYSRYSFTMLPDGVAASDIFETVRRYEVALDGIPIAQWTQSCPKAGDLYLSHLHMKQGSERAIFKALGLADSDYEDFVATEEARLACMYVDNREEIPGPIVEVIEVDLLSE